MLETLVTKKVSLVLPSEMSDINTKERIRLKVQELFMKYGVRSVSMDDIAAALGVSKKTIYQYYSDKDELVDAFIMSEIDHNEGLCNYDKEAALDAVHEMYLAMDMIAELFRAMNPSLLFDIQKYHPAAFLKFSNHKNEYLYNVIRENLMRGIKEDLYRAELNVDLIARFRVESMLLPFSPEFQSIVKHNLAEVEIELIEHFTFGLVNPKGYKLAVKYKQERIKKLLINGKNK